MKASQTFQEIARAQSAELARRDVDYVLRFWANLPSAQEEYRLQSVTSAFERFSSLTLERARTAMSPSEYAAYEEAVKHPKQGSLEINVETGIITDASTRKMLTSDDPRWFNVRSQDDWQRAAAYYKSTYAG